MPEPIQIISVSLEFLGTLLIGLAVLRVHTKLKREHKIDDVVSRSIQRERKYTIIGLVLITLGFILQLIN